MIKAVSHIPDNKRYTKGAYEKLGDRLRRNPQSISESDYEMLQYLRTSYKEPMSKIFNIIDLIANKVDKNCICTYRIKRIDSIVSKLLRFPDMIVNRAEDIAGCRCILTSQEAVYKLYDKILKVLDKYQLEIKGKVHDYIDNPKESGYQSIHLNLTLKGDNRRVEIQLRTLEQHNWATLVEITDLLYGLKLKEIGPESDESLYQLHQLLSKPLTRLSKQDIYCISDNVITYDYIRRIGDVFSKNYIDVRKHWYTLKKQRNYFYLISTGQDGIPDIQSFSNFDQAEACYFDSFINNGSNKNIVLTHIRNTNFAKISAAYSNYFLTYNSTLLKILICLSKAVEISFKRHRVSAFRKYYKAFLDIMLFWMQNQILEMNSFAQNKNVTKSKKIYNEWGQTIVDGVYAFTDIFQSTHLKLRLRLYNIIIYRVMKKMNNDFHATADMFIKS